MTALIDGKGDLIVEYSKSSLSFKSDRVQYRVSKIPAAGGRTWFRARMESPIAPAVNLDDRVYDVYADMILKKLGDSELSVSHLDVEQEARTVAASLFHGFQDMCAFTEKDLLDTRNVKASYSFKPLATQTDLVSAELLVLLRAAKQAFRASVIKWATSYSIAQLQSERFDLEDRSIQAKIYKAVELGIEKNVHILASIASIPIILRQAQRHPPIEACNACKEDIEDALECLAKEVYGLERSAAASQGKPGGTNKPNDSDTKLKDVTSEVAPDKAKLHTIARASLFNKYKLRCTPCIFGLSSGIKCVAEEWTRAAHRAQSGSLCSDCMKQGKFGMSVECPEHDV